MTAGITFAFLALLSWGFGDFFLQRAVRTFGNVRTLLYIGVTGAVVLFPFVQGEFFRTSGNPIHLALLLVAGVVTFFAALFDFEALKQGKLAIVEPVLGVELPVTVALSVVLWGEAFSLVQILLIGATFIGIVLAVTVHHSHLRYRQRSVIEKGVAFAGVGAITMGLVNFLFGVGAQETSPLMTMWFVNVVFSALCLLYIAVRGEFAGIGRDIARSPRIFTAVCLLDNAAWTFYAFATSYIPIGIATTISESYIALTVLLGLFINREKLKYHQYIGVAIAILSVILLAATL